MLIHLAKKKKGNAEFEFRANPPPLDPFLGYYLSNYEVGEPTRKAFR